MFASAQLISCSGPDCTLCDFLKTGSNIINLLTQIAVPISVVFIIYGGFMIMTAGPSEERAGQGRKILTSAIIGVAIVLGSWLILNTVFLILNAQTPTPWNKIQCAAGGPNFGKYETATGGLTGSDTGGVATGNESTGFAASVSKEEGVARTWLGDGGVGEYEVQNESSDFYFSPQERQEFFADSVQYNDDGTVTMTMENGTVVTETGLVSLEGAQITMTAEEFNKIDWDDFDSNGRLSLEDASFTVTEGAIITPIAAVDESGNRVSVETEGAKIIPDSYSAGEARAMLQQNGININRTNECSGGQTSGCTSTEGIRGITIDALKTIKNECSNCQLTITGGTEGGHAQGIYSHSNGYKVDLRFEPALDQNIYAKIGTNIPIINKSYKGSDGNIYIKEKDHWDVAVPPKTNPKAKSI
mgnify:CR=1 FL=1